MTAERAVSAEGGRASEEGWKLREMSPHSPSLRAQRSNPESFRGGSLDCFVARAPRNDGGEGGVPRPGPQPADDGAGIVRGVATLSVIASAAKQSRVFPRRQSGLLRRKSSSQ
ncbi:hypothetical protein FXV83_31550 [Bradyrhizobium hipponense]|uniref:Uncharacterized protein n=1 Tax=Bradyrhizobium hipponense TaxID=2605638 RepID=A0A5S4YE18_9BRAD|nr:hypothetical protein FXV83_31550 [Bradyrhizobium hipponense]